MIEAYYRTGQVAKLLKVSSYHVRRLCETGLIEAEFSGQQWKVPAREVERLRKQGVPPLPQLSEDEGEEVPQPPTDHDVADSSNGFYDGPSRAVIQSVEQVAITENRLKRRRLEKDLEETEDFFRERQRRVNAEQAVEKERIARLQSEQRRQQWADRWLQYALKAVPSDAPQQITLDVHQMVAEALERLQPSQPEYIVRRVVDAAEEKALAPWKRQKDIRKIIDDAREKLPYGAKGYREPTNWETRVLQESAAEIATLRKDATYEEIRAVAIKVVNRVGAEFEHIEANRFFQECTFGALRVKSSKRRSKRC
jgi:excisionase family DNA binding protein